MSRYRVMVVDDDPDIRFVISGLLAAHYETVQAENGLDALEKIDRYEPDLVLLDVEMPVMDGFAACRSIRRTSGLANLPVFFITGRSSADTQRKAREAGCSAFFEKPFNTGKLVERIQSYFTESTAVPKPKLFSTDELQKIDLSPLREAEDDEEHEAPPADGDSTDPAPPAPQEPQEPQEPLRTTAQIRRPENLIETHEAEPKPKRRRRVFGVADPQIEEIAPQEPKKPQTSPGEETPAPPSKPKAAEPAPKAPPPKPKSPPPPRPKDVSERAPLLKPPSSTTSRPMIPRLDLPPPDEEPVEPAARKVEPPKPKPPVREAAGLPPQAPTPPKATPPKAPTPPAKPVEAHRPAAPVPPAVESPPPARPAAQQPAAPPSKGAPSLKELHARKAAKKSPRPRVLCVIDERRELAAYAEALKGKAEFLPLENAVEAVEIIARYQPDVLFLHIVGSDYSGLEIVRMLQTNPRLAHISTVFLSNGREDPGLMQAAHRFSKRDSVRTPLIADGVRRALEAVVSQPGFSVREKKLSYGTYVSEVLQKERAAHEDERRRMEEQAYQDKAAGLRPAIEQAVREFGTAGPARPRDRKLQDYYLS